VDQENAYQFAVQVCQQVGVQLPSFDQLGQTQTSGASGGSIGTGALVGAVGFGLLGFVAGLI